MTRKIALVALAWLALLGPSHAQKPYKYAVGTSSPLRKTLLNAVRPTIEKDLGVKVKFEVRRLHADATWAFLDGVALGPDGKPIDLKKTRLRDVEPLDGPTVFALLRKRNGRWRIVTHSIGPTDVVWGGWDEEFGVPSAVLGKSQKARSGH